MSIDDDYYEVRAELKRSKSPVLENFERLSDHYAKLDEWEMEWGKIIGALTTLRRFLVAPNAQSKKKEEDDG